MKAVTSKDGTTIAYDHYGSGPAIVLVDGALQYREYRAFGQGMTRLAELLSPQFTVIHHDRRGRGESTDTQPYALEREIEDIEALIDSVGGNAALYGISSGAALALEAALAMPTKISMLVMYEPPYNPDEAARRAWRDFRRDLAEALGEGRNADAVGLFMVLLGMPLEQLEGARQDPMFPLFEAVAPTLAYDAAALGEEADIPADRAGRLTQPALILDGGASEWSFMHTTAVKLANVIPNSQHWTLEGQSHDPAPEALARLLAEFIGA
jgi:pimeloyl-ACP methyl ester carboxylesterase